MSKILPATCAAGVVTADGVVLPGAEILSEGVGESEGIAILDEDQAVYLAKISPDLATLLEKLIAALGQVKTALDKTVEGLEKAANALTAIDTHAPLVTTCGSGAGTATWTPVAATNITGIGTAKTAVAAAATQIDTIKGQLQTLSEALR